ncbi:MAG: type VI secretion system lipoprotein TssJ [Ideonella sp. MAG2]|nr:MAG: type VI secretion system lipoprotein TssJ [Ideonella sp. MAG2]
MAAGLAWALVTTGFAVQAQDKERTRLTLQVQASMGVNPDASGKAYPIKVRVYELKDAQVFQEAEYFTLDEKDKTALGGDLLARDEFILRPGESRKIERKSQAATQFIGVLAGYRDLAQSTWRAVYRLPEAPEAAWFRAVIPSNKSDISIELQAQGIVLSVAP